MQWENFGYTKWSRREHWLEWALIEALLSVAAEEDELRYVGSSGVDYPSFPQGVGAARRCVEAAARARALLANFEAPARGDASARVCASMWADAMERHLQAHVTPWIAEYAADQFLRILIENREEEPELG